MKLLTHTCQPAGYLKVFGGFLLFVFSQSTFTIFKFIFIFVKIYLFL